MASEINKSDKVFHFAEFQELCEKKDNFEFFRQLAAIQKPGSQETSQNRTSIQDCFCCRRAENKSTSDHKEIGTEKVHVTSDTDDDHFESRPLL